MFADPRCKQNILYFYHSWQDTYEAFSKENIVTHWHNFLPTAEFVQEKTEFFKGRGGSIIIIDDFQGVLNKEIFKIFSILTHHLDLVTICLVQNIFAKNTVFRDISLNASNIILFKNPRDSSQINRLAAQIKPGNSQFIIDAYKECTKTPYSYLMICNHQLTPDIIRVRSRCLPSELPMIIWLEKTCK